MPVADLFKPRGDRVEGLVPTHALEEFVLAPALQRPFRHAGFAAQRIENPIRRVDAVKVLRHLAAKKTPRDRLRGVAFHFHSSTFLVHCHQDCARVRAIVRADRVNDAEGWGSSHGVIVS